MIAPLFLPVTGNGPGSTFDGCCIRFWGLQFSGGRRNSRAGAISAFGNFTSSFCGRRAQAKRDRSSFSQCAATRSRVSGAAKDDGAAVRRPFVTNSRRCRTLTAYDLVAVVLNGGVPKPKPRPSKDGENLGRFVTFTLSEEVVGSGDRAVAWQCMGGHPTKSHSRGLRRRCSSR
jgi:hypothetical protein